MERNSDNRWIEKLFPKLFNGWEQETIEQAVGKMERLVLEEDEEKYKLHVETVM